MAPPIARTADTRPIDRITARSVHTLTALITAETPGPTGAGQGAVHALPAFLAETGAVGVAAAEVVQTGAGQSAVSPI